MRKNKCKHLESFETNEKTVYKCNLKKGEKWIGKWLFTTAKDACKECPLILDMFNKIKV